MPFLTPSFGVLGSPTKIDYRQNKLGTNFFKLKLLEEFSVTPPAGRLSASGGSSEAAESEARVRSSTPWPPWRPGAAEGAAGRELRNKRNGLVERGDSLVLISFHFLGKAKWIFLGCISYGIPFLGWRDIHLPAIF